MSGFRLVDPVWLLLALPALWLPLREARRRDAVLYSSVALLRGLPVTPAQRVKRLLPWAWSAAIVLLAFALARPQHGKEEFRVRAEGIAIEMVLDKSGSMQALDFELDGKRANRLAVVKKVFREFVAGEGGLPGRPDDLIGLVAFGGFAESMCPLTFDHGALLQVLEQVKIPEEIRDARGRVLNERLLEEEMATAIGDALALAVERLRDVKAKSKVVILLSDGESNAGVVAPEEAAQLAKTLGVKVYTIGVGTTGVVPFPAVDPFGRAVLVRQQVRMDEECLRGLADATGGKYFNAQDTESLKNVYAEIDRLEKTLAEGHVYTEYRELYRWVLWPALALLVLELALVSTRFRSLP